jgi:uncharacterized membrane protein
MANPVLLKSSILFGLIHIALIAFLKVNPWLIALYIIGILTSILNHAYTSNTIKWFDRSWMALGTIINIILLFILPFWYKIVCLILLISYVSLFFAAKYIINKTKEKRYGNIPHIICHFGATLCHSLMMLGL